MYDQIKHKLSQAYDNKVDERSKRQIQDWKLADRAQFLAKLDKTQQTYLLEIGAGTGEDSLFFQEQGLTVTCIDLSPANVRACQEKGVNAQQMDVCQLQFPANSFDAAFTLNCLLHLPKDQFPIALQQIHSVLKSGGLFYLGIYGGYDFAGIWKDDRYEPKRFFAFHTDEVIQQIVQQQFDLLSFKTIPLNEENEQLHFQTMLLRKPLT